eukprot:TRINITY_DN29209_c0_g1_i1.p3 TRINITY_DN29209_c0_g1~~TRINITY_DN29209_c0_g1_i1.p3  ORF type:complete len:53 (+),score=0.30 TRINITY_DN29209_c0_g1_i1:464-622(+)
MLLYTGDVITATTSVASGVIDRRLPTSELSNGVASLALRASDERPLVGSIAQ